MPRYTYKHNEGSVERPIPSDVQERTNTPPQETVPSPQQPPNQDTSRLQKEADFLARGVIAPRLDAKNPGSFLQKARVFARASESRNLEQMGLRSDLSAEEHAQYRQYALRLQETLNRYHDAVIDQALREMRDAASAMGFGLSEDVVTRCELEISLAIREGQLPE